jgi:hypothetical protein
MQLDRTTRTTRTRRAALGVLTAVIAAGTLGFAAPASATTHHPSRHVWIDAGTQTATFQCGNAECTDLVDFVATGRGLGIPVGPYTIGSANGTNTWTARNGDTVTSAATPDPLPADDVHCRPDEFASKGVEHFTGGTGRFAGATGSYTTRACAVATGVSDTGVVSIRLRWWDVGTIRY